MKQQQQHGRRKVSGATLAAEVLLSKMATRRLLSHSVRAPSLRCFVSIDLKCSSQRELTVCSSGENRLIELLVLTLY